MLAEAVLPSAFCAALINSQPMGFYPPAQLVTDAKSHGVHVLPVDVNHSDWDCTIEDASVSDSPEAKVSEPGLAPKRLEDLQSGSIRHSPLRPESAEAKSRSLRLGLRMISGLRGEVVEIILEARRSGPFQTVSEFTRRTGLGQAALATLSRADAFGSLNQSRREALWQSLAQEKQPKVQPLFAGLELDDDQTEQLPQLSLADQVTEDYRTVGLSLRAHPLSFIAKHLASCTSQPVVGWMMC